MLNRVYYDRSDIGLSDDVSISVESYDEKTDENTEIATLLKSA